MYLLRTLADLILPRHCAICHRLLQAGEQELCCTCLSELPLCKTSDFYHNVLARLFWGIIPIERAASLMTYQHGTKHQEILVLMKYKQRPDLAQFMGRILATELLSRNFFQGIDLIIPAPLSPKRRRHRGYNQSEEIARGLSSVSHIPVCTTAVQRTVDNPSQTHFNAAMRYENVRNIFAVTHPELLQGKHILLVDDIITTGATMIELAYTIHQASPTTIFSITSIAQSTDMIHA